LLDKTFLIRPKPEKEEVIPPLPIEASGRVTDSDGKPLAGVSIVIAGGSGGVSTDEEGRYRITVAENNVLRFSYVGFEARQISVQKQKVIDVALSPATKAMGDIVVVGYGTQQRSNVTGAIASVSAKDFEKQPIAGLDQAIAGQAAGVQVAQRTGTPGGGVTIRVRGTGSISAGNEPLYVIDGFPMEGSYNRDFNPLSTINPNDIESIQILKDAASASIYGSRGSNGVVLITTKRGKTGKPSIQLSSYYGVQEVAHKIDMLDAREYAIFNTEARNNAWVDAGGKATDPNSLRPNRFKIPPMFANPDSLGEGTDWQDEVFRRAPIQNYQLTISGGNDAVQYFVSGGYFNQKGIVINTGFQRYSMRMNLDAKVSSKIKVGVNFAPSYSKNDVLPVEDQVFVGGILGSALSMPPTIPVYNSDGSFTTLLGTSPYNLGVIDNPVAIATKIKGGATSVRILTNVFGEWEILKDLKFKSSFGLSYFDSRYDYYSPSTLGRDGLPAPVTPIGNANMGRDITWLNENTLTYDRVINVDHHLNVLAGIRHKDHALIMDI
jgi:TonB-linked SusC/RagA family outer membrane protein